MKTTLQVIKMISLMWMTLFMMITLYSVNWGRREFTNDAMLDSLYWQGLLLAIVLVCKFGIYLTNKYKISKK